jgi:hypothetical protein
MHPTMPPATLAGGQEHPQHSEVADEPDADYDSDDAALAAAMAEEAEMEAAYAEEAELEAGGPVAAPPPPSFSTNNNRHNLMQPPRMTTMQVPMQLGQKKKTHEERCAPFFKCLDELKISSFSLWDDEKSKFARDPRALELSDKQRKAAFETYCAERAAAEKRKKAKKARKVRDGFMALLTESKLSTQSRFLDFKSRGQVDKRYLAVKTMKERTALFDEFITELKETKRVEKGGGALKEQKRLAKEGFIALLVEKNVKVDTSWRRLEDKIYRDRRFEAVRSAEREGYFRDYVRMLDKTEEEALEMEKAKRREASLRARKEEVQKTKQQSAAAWDVERDQFRRDEDEKQFKLFLVDKIRAARCAFSAEIYTRGCHWFPRLLA